MTTFESVRVVAQVVGSVVGVIMLIYFAIKIGGDFKAKRFGMAIFGLFGALVVFWVTGTLVRNAVLFSLAPTVPLPSDAVSSTN